MKTVRRGRRGLEFADGSGPDRPSSPQSLIGWAPSPVPPAFCAGAILLLPHSRWRDLLPAQPRFYRYAAAMCALNCATLLGAALLEAGVSEGFCAYGLGAFAYYALFPPLLYRTFLADFFREDGLAGDHSGYFDEMRDAGFLDGFLLMDGDGDDF